MNNSDHPKSVRSIIKINLTEGEPDLASKSLNLINRKRRDTERIPSKSSNIKRELQFQRGSKII